MTDVGKLFVVKCSVVDITCFLIFQYFPYLRSSSIFNEEKSLAFDKGGNRSGSMDIENTISVLL